MEQKEKDKNVASKSTCDNTDISASHNKMKAEENVNNKKQVKVVKGKTKDEKPENNKWTFKQRLVLTLLLSVAVSLVLLFFGPIMIFGGNINEFHFVLGDFIWWNVLALFLAVGVLCGILLPLKGLAFDIVYSIFLFLTVALFVQGNYLNGSSHSLGADAGGVNGSVAFNSIMWVVIGAIIITGIMLLRKKHREIIRLASIILMVTVMGVSAVSTVTLAFSENLFVSHSDRVEENRMSGREFLTFNNMGKVSENKNIFYFVVDRFDWTFYTKALEQNPDYFDQFEALDGLDGFTLYDDGISLYPRTFPSIAYMLGGKPNDWDKPRVEFFEDEYKNSKFLNQLKDNNYNVNLYTDVYYAYDDAKVMGNYINNSMPISDYYVRSTGRLSMDMTSLSLYRYFPLFLKKAILIDSGRFANIVGYEGVDVCTQDMRDLFNLINSKDFETYSGKNNFSFVHFSGTHTPFLYDENFNPVVLNNDVVSALTQSFKIINRFISELKRLNLYKDSTIIITGDHGFVHNDTKAPDYAQTIPIFFKASGNAGTPMVTDDAPVCHKNIHASILKSVGLSYKDNYAPPMDEVTSGTEREFRYQRSDVKNGVNYEEIIYKINGKAKDFSNWKIDSKRFLNKDIYK